MDGLRLRKKLPYNIFSILFYPNKASKIHWLINVPKKREVKIHLKSEYKINLLVRAEGKPISSHVDTSSCLRLKGRHANLSSRLARLRARLERMNTQSLLQS